MNTRMKKKRLLKTREVADICGVSPRTVAQWLRDGVLRGIKINGFTWRVREEDVNEFLEGRQETP